MQDDLSDFVPLFRGPGSCVERGIFPTEDAARFFWLSNKVELVGERVCIKRGRNWYAHPARLKALLLADAQRRAREAIARERRTADEISAGREAA